jgi:hypothetical protein
VTGHPPDSDDAAARLVERVLSDAAFRARFRRDPAGAADEAGLDPITATAVHPALETLDLRESKSSLAGALMAAAVEGLALYEVVDHGGLGPASAEAAVGARPAGDLAVLHDPNIHLDASGAADLRAGRIDPRIVAILEQVSKRHQIGVSALLSDHAARTTTGSLSNHHFGRAVDIATVDGRPVSPSNEAARKLAAALLRLDPRLRPTELGSPWDLHDPVAFTDGAHQNHIHVAFDDPIEPGRAPPKPTAVGADASDDTAGPDSDDSGDSDDSHSDDADDLDTPDSDDSDDVDAPDDDADDDEESDDDDEDADEEDSGGEDENEPDEDEADESGPDFDDLTDDERQPGDGLDASEDDGADGASADGGDTDDIGDDGDDGASPDGGDTDDIDDDGDGDGATEGGGEVDLGDVDAVYPGDPAPPEQVAAWMAAQAQRRGLPAELPVMAALVESGMRNLPGGDADSVGFFQMRTSIWDRGDYAGYARQPQLQLDWFLDHAEEVRRQRIARGLPVRDPHHYGEWIADVERPAEQYRDRYQLRLAEAHELLSRFHAPASARANEAQVLPVIRPDQVTRRPR